MKTTNQIGDLAEIFIAAHLMRVGKKIFKPLNTGLRYDLLIEENGQYKKVQCKSGRYSKGTIIFLTCSVDRTTGETRKYSEEEVDYFGIYSPDFDSVYMVPARDVKDLKNKVSLRTDEPKNNNKKLIRWAKDYII